MAAAFKYKGDDQFANEKDFLEWIAQLDKIIEDFGDHHEGNPYGGPLAESTGLSCWFQYFDEGYSPEQAFAEDRMCWE